MYIPSFSVCFQRVIFLADIEPNVDVQQVVDCVYVYGGHLSGVWDSHSKHLTLFSDVLYFVFIV